MPAHQVSWGLERLLPVLLRAHKQPQLNSCFYTNSQRKRVPLQVTYDLTLARYYMWAQTDSHVFLAVHVPTGVTPLPSLPLHSRPGLTQPGCCGHSNLPLAFVCLLLVQLLASARLAHRQSKAVPSGCLLAA